jgi:hypothetical protein
MAASLLPLSGTGKPVPSSRAAQAAGKTEGHRKNCFGVLFYGFLKRKIPGRTGSFGFPSPASLRRGTGKAFQAVHAVPFMIFSTDEGTGGQAAKVFFNPFLPFLFLCRQTG